MSTDPDCQQNRLKIPALMPDWIVWAPMLAAVGCATIAKATLHREMRKLTQAQIQTWSTEFMTQRMWQFGGIIAVLCIILYVSSGRADRTQALMGLAGAGALIALWLPFSLLSTRKAMMKLELPGSFQRAVLIDKVMQGLLLGLFLFYGFKNAGFTSL